MISIKGYDIIELVRETSNFAVFEAESPVDGKICVLRLSLLESFNVNLKRVHDIQSDLSKRFPKMWLPTVDSGIDGEGRFYSVTPKPEMSLDTLLKAGARLGGRDIAALLKSLALSLSALEEYKISHGGICAENIYFLSEGKKNPTKLAAYSVKLSEISPETGGDIASDVQTLAKIAYALAAKKRSLWAVPNSSVKNFDFAGNVFSKKKFSVFFNKYISADGSSAEILKNFARDVSKLNGGSKIPAACAFFALIAIGGFLLYSQFQAEPERDFQKESVEITAAELESLWRGYCSDYAGWFEKLSELGSAESMGAFKEYYQSKIIPLMQDAEFSVSDYDPRSSKLADLDIDVYSDIFELSVKCPGQILSSAEKKVSLLKLSAKIKEVKDAVLQWEGVLKLDSFYKFFGERKIDLKWIRALKGGLFSKDIWGNLEKIGKIADSYGECTEKYSECFSLAEGLPKFKDDYAASFGVELLEKSMSGTESFEQFEGLLNAGLARLRDLTEFCKNNYGNDIVDISLMKKERALVLEPGNWDKIEKWKAYVLEYTRIKQGEFSEKKQVWSGRIGKMEKDILQLGKTDLKNIPELNSLRSNLLKDIEACADIPRVEKYRGKLSGAIAKVEKSLSAFENACGDYVLSQRENLKDAINLWMAAVKGRKWANQRITSLWKAKTAETTNGYDEASYLSGAEKFISDRDMLSEFAKRLDEIDSYGFIAKDVKIPSALPKSLSSEIERILNDQYDKSMGEILAAAENMPIGKISVSEILKSPALVEASSHFKREMSDIQALADLLEELSSFSESRDFDAQMYENALKKASQSKAFGKLNPGISSQYKIALSFAEKISRVSDVGELLQESSAPEIPVICGILAWNKIFSILKQNPKAFEFKKVREESDKFSSKLFPSKKEAFFKELKNCFVAALAAADFPDGLDSLQKYIAHFNVSDKDLDADVAAKLFLFGRLKELKQSSKATLAECRNFADSILAQLSSKYPGAKATGLLREKIDSIKNGLSEKLFSDKPAGPAAAGGTLVKKDGMSATYSHSGCELDFQEIETQNGEIYYLSSNEISADAFIRVFDAQKLWSKNKNLMPMCVREFDIYDSRTGPRVWIAKNDSTMRLRRNDEPWLEKPPTWMDYNIMPEGVNSNADTAKLPMQYVSPQLALAFAKAIGCELPTDQVMKIAISQEQNPAKIWNLRDSAFAKQSEHLKTLISQNQLENLTADGESYKNALGISAEENSGSGVDDNCAWFEEIDSRGGKFHHIIGNVAEYVATSKGFAIMGGSSISDTMKPTWEPIDISGIDSSNGFSDVGFRVMFKKDKMNSNMQLYTAIANLVKTL